MHHDRLEKVSCKLVEQDIESQGITQKGPRWSWAQNEIGNPKSIRSDIRSIREIHSAPVSAAGAGSVLYENQIHIGCADGIPPELYCNPLDSLQRGGNSGGSHRSKPAAVLSL
jgi:hypothetical protein